MKNTNKAFTLVELIVVITILAILGTIAFISLQGYSQDAKNSKVVSDTRTIVTAIETSLVKGAVSMSQVVDVTIPLQADSLNGLDTSATFGSGVALTPGTNYKVGLLNFIGLRQNSGDFKDNDGNDYIAATAINGTDDSFYQIAGQTVDADGTHTSVIKGNYIGIIASDAIGLITPTGTLTHTGGLINSVSSMTTLY